MHVDAITLAAIVDELRLLLANARIDTIIQPTEHALAIQCYTPSSQGQSGQNRWLYLSAHPQLARIHITALKPAKLASEPPPFVMLLRKHLEGARIESISQPRWERVVEIVAGYKHVVGEKGVEKRNQDDKKPQDGESDIQQVQCTRFRLIIEIMGRVSNIILCDEQGMILGSLKRVGADVNRYRTIVAGVPYVPPPPQQRMFAGQTLPRLEPTTITAAQLALCAADRNDDTSEQATQEQHTGKARKKGGKGGKRTEIATLWQLLTKHLLGLSPLLAREIVYRTTENTETALIQGEQNNTDLWEELAWNIRDLTALYDTHTWQPQLVERNEKMPDTNSTQRFPIAFAIYTLEQYAHQQGMHIRHSPSINVLLDDYYARAEWHDAMEGLRSPIRKVLQAQRERCLRKAELLSQELATSEEAARYRFYGDLLIAHQHDVVQGQSSVELHNLFEDTNGDGGPLVTIPLDPRFDAVGNANRLFNKYHKLRRALELVPSQIEQNTVELVTIEQLLADLMLAETPPEVALVRAEVQAAGYLRGKNQFLDRKEQKAAKKGKAGKSGKGSKQAKPTGPGGGVPLHVQSREGFTILIGKNSRQNEEVTFHQATGNDMWLHVRGVPGSHVIVKAAGRAIPQSTIEQAARLAAYYSQSRGSTSVPVDYTLQKHVKHMKGGGPGMVIYERERTLYAQPENR